MIRHTFIYFVAFALPGLLGFASFGAYTRVLTPAEYAVYSIGVSVSFLVGNVCFGWVRFSIGRFQAEMPEFNFLPFALACLAGMAIVVGPLAVLGAVLVTGAPALVIVAVLSMTLGQALFDITQEMRRARRQSTAFTKASVARSVLGIGLSVSAATYFREGAAVLFAIAAGFAVVGLNFVISNRRHLVARDILKGPTKRFLTYGMPLAISGLVISGNSTLARVMVANELGSVTAGQYGAALDVTGQLMTVVAGSVCAIMGPAAIRAFAKKGATGARQELAAGFELLLGILLPLIVGMMVVAQPFAAVVSGHEFTSTLGMLLPMLAVSRGLNVFAQYYLHLGFQIVETPMRQVVCGGATLAINLIMNFLLMRHFGLMGAAAALVLADLCGVLVAFLLLRPVFPMPFPVAKALQIAAATAAMGVFCQAVLSLCHGGPLATLVLTIASGGGVYGALVVIFDIGGVRTSLWTRGYRPAVPGV